MLISHLLFKCCYSVYCTTSDAFSILFKKKKRFLALNVTKMLNAATKLVNTMSIHEQNENKFKMEGKPNLTRALLCRFNPDQQRATDALNTVTSLFEIYCVSGRS